MCCGDPGDKAERRNLECTCLSFRGRSQPLLSQGGRARKQWAAGSTASSSPGSSWGPTDRSCVLAVTPCADRAAKTLPPLPSPTYLLELLDLLLQLCLPCPAVVLLEPQAAAPASPLLSFQFEELQVLELLPEVLNELQRKGRGQLSAACPPSAAAGAGHDWCGRWAVLQLGTASSTAGLTDRSWGCTCLPHPPPGL